MSARYWILLATVLGVAAGCKAADPCNHKSPCSKDPTDKTACKPAEAATKGSLCFNETVAYATCYNDNIICGADDTTDPTATRNKAMSFCSSQLSAFNSCCNTNTAAAACN